MTDFPTAPPGYDGNPIRIAHLAMEGHTHPTNPALALAECAPIWFYPPDITNTGETIILCPGCNAISRKKERTPPEKLNNRSKLLRGAEKAINGDRNNQYGDPVQDFRRTADLWSTFLDTDIQPWQVSAMLALLKLSRIAWNPSKEDSWMDLAGYAGCGWDVVERTINDDSEC